MFKENNNIHTKVLQNVLYNSSKNFETSNVVA